MALTDIEIVPVIYDPQSDAQTYARCARRLMIEDEELQ